MIRSIDWRDLSLLRHVRDQGLCLDSQLTFTRGPQAWPQGLLDVFAPRRSAPMLVARSERKQDQPALGRISHKPTEPYARLTFICPADALKRPEGLALLEGLCRQAGQRGAHHLIGEVDEHSPAFESLRRAGYAIYARQRIWQKVQGSAGEVDQRSTSWTPETPADHADVQDLYLDLVPAMVQHVEAPPGGNGQGLVHRVEGELLGYLDIDRGPLGTWVQPYLHPAAENVDALLAGFMAAWKDGSGKPVYICVRSYQGWMNHVLQRLGFEPMTDQAVMVKHLAVRLRKPLLAPLPAMEGTSPEPTAPIATMRDANSAPRCR